MSDSTRFKELAQRLAARTDELRSQRAISTNTLLVPQARRIVERHLDDVTRESHLRMVRSLVGAFRHCGFQLLVDQATLGKVGLDELSDDELIELHRNLDRARECMQDGIDFQEAGLLRSFG